MIVEDLKSSLNVQDFEKARNLVCMGACPAVGMGACPAVGMGACPAVSMGACPAHLLYVPLFPSLPSQ